MGHSSGWLCDRHIAKYQSEKLKYWLQLLLNHKYFINSLWPTDAICRHRSGSTLVQVMDWCLTTPSHYLDQCWLLISEVLWHSSESNSTARAQAIILHNDLESYILKITVISTRGHCVITVYTENKTSCLQNSVSWNMFVSMTISSCPWHVTHKHRSNEIGIFCLQPYWI